MKKRILSMLLVIVLVLSVVPVSALAEDGGEQGSVAPAELEVYQLKSKTSVKVGGNVNLTVRMTDGSKPGTVSWSDEPKGLVELTYVNPKTVKVYGKATGSVTIMATNANGLTDTYELTVEPGATATASEATTAPAATTAPEATTAPAATTAPEATQSQKEQQTQGANLETETPSTYALGDLTISGEDSVLVGESVTLKMTAEKVPDLIASTATWTVDQETKDFPGKILIEGSGVTRTVTGLTAGSVRINVKLGTKKTSFDLTVKNNTFAAIQFTDGTTKMSVGEAKELMALDKGDGEITGVTWAVAGDGAVLDGNKLTVDKAGDVTVTASKDGYDNKSETITVEVVGLESIDVTNYPASKEMTAGDTLALDIQYIPGNATDKNVTWHTTDASIAEVIDGELHAYKTGDVTLTAKQAGNRLWRKTLKVNPASRIELDSNLPEKVYVGESVALRAKLLKSANNAELDGVIEWTFADANDGNYADLIDGKLIPKRDLIGQKTITLIASVKDSKFDAVPVSYVVTMIPRAKSITLRIDGQVFNNKEYNVDVLGTDGVTIEAEIAPDYAEQAVDWQISGDTGIFNKKKDARNKLTLTPNGTKNIGNVKITAVTVDGSDASATITIRFVREGESDLKGAPTKLCGGASLNMSSFLEQDKYMTDKTVTWGLKDTSDVVNGKSVATKMQVAAIGKNGKLTTKPVTAKTQIIVTMKGSVGAEKEHPITLYPATKSITISGMSDTGININGANKTIKYKDGMVLYLTGDAKPFDVWPLTWSSSNKKVATVDPDTGVVTILDAGKVRIDCTTTDGSKTKGSLNLEITKDAKSVKITAPSKSLAAGKSMNLTATVMSGNGVKAANQKVTWDVTGVYGEDTDAAQVSGTGRFTAMYVNQSTEVMVTATSVADPEVSGSIVLTVVPNVNKTLHAMIDGELVSGSYTMDVDDYGTLKGVWLQNNGKWTDAKNCEFFIDDEDVVTVEDGELTAVGYGTADITMRCTDTQTGSVFTSTFTVYVMDTVRDVTISVPDDCEYLRSGEILRLSATAWTYYGKGKDDVKAENQDFDWEVKEVVPGGLKDTDIVTIDSNGVLEADTVYEEHEIEVKAISQENGVCATVRLMVYPEDELRLVFALDGKEFEGVISADYDKIKKDADGYLTGMTVTAKTAPEGKDGSVTVNTTSLDPNKLTWSSSNEDVIEVVKKRNLKLVGTGTTRLTVEGTQKIDGEKYDFEATITLNVNQLVGKVIIEKSGELASGKSIYLSATVANPDATNKKMLWSLDPNSEEFATIGRYTGKLSAKRGLTEKKTIWVTATPADGSDTAKAKVTIYPLTTKVEIRQGAKVISGTTVQVVYEDTPSFSATANPSNAYQKFKWTSSNTSVAVVDPDTGDVTIKGVGKTVIKATAVDGSNKSAKFTLRVK